jgi:hypothetical protein
MWFIGGNIPSLKNMTVGYILIEGEPPKACISYILEGIDRDVNIQLYHNRVDKPEDMRLEVIMDVSKVRSDAIVTKHIVKSLVSNIHASLTVLEQLLDEVPKKHREETLNKLKEGIERLLNKYSGNNVR